VTAAAGSPAVTVMGTATPTAGAPVCRSGATTGRRCGTVTATDVTANYATGPVLGLTLTTACSEGGDSGGPFVSGSSAVGTLSGGSADCSSPEATSLYQPIDEVLRNESLSLVTGDPATPPGEPAQPLAAAARPLR
jgi:streptogrisin C